MTNDPSLVEQAEQWLDQLSEDLSSDPLYMKSGEEFLERMEWQIRLYKGEMFEAIKAALGIWLRGEDIAKTHLALALIRRLGATEYLGDVEKLRDRIRAGVVDRRLLPLSSVEAVLDDLREQRAREEANGR